MTSRRATRALLTALAAETSVADALTIAALAELEGERGGPSSATSTAADHLRAAAEAAKGAPLDRPTLDALALDPPLAGAVVATPDPARRARAAQLLSRALTAEPGALRGLYASTLPFVGGLTIAVVVTILDVFVGPVLGLSTAPLRAATALAGLGAFAGLWSLHLRFHGIPWWAALATALGPGLPLAHGLRRRNLSREGALRAIAAAEVAGLSLRDAVPLLAAPGAARSAGPELVLLRRAARHTSTDDAIAAWTGPTSLAGTLARARFGGDDDASAHVRLARLAALDTAGRGLPDALAGLGAACVLLGVWLATSSFFAALSTMAGRVQ